MGCVVCVGTVEPRWASSRPAPQPLWFYSSLSLHSSSSFAPQDPSQLWKALPGENQLSPKLPQDGATNSRLGFCQLLQKGEKTQNRDKVSQETAGRPPPQASSVPLRCDSAPQGDPQGLFSPLWQVPWFGSYLLCCPSPCCLSLLAHLPASLSICLSLPPSLLSPLFTCAICLPSSSANLMLLHLTQVHLKKKL